MGLPTSAAYLLLAVLVAPALARLGLPPIVAHMFIFYFGLVSAITPPVAPAAYAAAGIAGTDANAPAWEAIRPGSVKPSGSASCRQEACQNGEILVVAEHINKHNNKTT